MLPPHPYSLLQRIKLSQAVSPRVTRLELDQQFKCSLIRALLHKPDFPLIYRARLGKCFHVEGNAKTFLSQLETYYRYELTDSREIRRSDPHIA